MTPTIAAALDAMAAGEKTGAELTQEALAAADELDAELGVFVTRFREPALAAAKEADRVRASGGPIGALHGVPVAVKDILSCADGPTTAQSLVYDRSVAHGDAGSVARLRAAGAVIVGKTTTMEFAVGTPDPAKPFPIPRNPWNTDLWAGGSSSGSASAVAAGLALGCLGTDTGGSIRMPAAFCGISGLKPTFGRVSMVGCIPLAYSMDHVGPMARSARDCAIMLNVLAGPDVRDPGSADVAVPDYPAALDGDVAGRTIGVDLDAMAALDGRDPRALAVFDDALRTLERHGARLTDLEIPHRGSVDDAHALLLDTEALSYHLADLPARWHDYTPSTRLRAASGALYTGADYLQAQRVRRVGQRALATVLREVDLIAGPTAVIGAMPVAELGDGLEPWMPYIHTGYWDAVGAPALTVPMGFTSGGMPLGLQMTGRWFDESTVLQAGDAYQRATDWHLHVPPVARVRLT